MDLELRYLFAKLAAQVDPMQYEEHIMSPIPNINEPQIALLSLQYHKAKRAGPHYDLRISLPGTKAFSWAIRKGLPEIGSNKKYLAVRTWDHPVEYQKFSGKLAPGYGEGTVELKLYEPIEILEANNKKIKFVLYNKSYPEEYTLVHTSGNNWLIINSTIIQNKVRIPTYKPKIKELNPNKPKIKFKIKRLLENDWVFTPKFDGVHSIIVLSPGKQIRVFSRVAPKNIPTGLIEYTHKIPGLLGKKAPQDIPDIVFRGEVFGYTQDKKMLPINKVTSILHSNKWRAEAKLKDMNANLAIYPFDLYRINKTIIEEKEPYINKLKLLTDISKKLPSQIWEPIVVSDSVKKGMLLHNVLREKKVEPGSFLEEGIVAWNLHEPEYAVKIKRKTTYDVYIQEIKEGSGRRSGEAGAIGYSLEPDGPVVGWVNTAPLPKKMRKDMLKQPSRFRNVAIRVVGLGLGTDKAIRHPVIDGIHEMKTAEQGKLDLVLKYLK